MKTTYTRESAAQFLNISMSQMDDLISSGTIPAAKISKAWVIREDDLDDYLADKVRIQTAERREAFRNGTKIHIKPASAEVTKRRRELPVLPPLAAIQEAA